MHHRTYSGKDRAITDAKSEQLSISEVFLIMDSLNETVGILVRLADAYLPGNIVEAERGVDCYLVAFHGYRSRSTAMDALLGELATPVHWAHNRGGLFEQVELHIQRRHREMARVFQ